jgi:hypothetical protein
MGFSEFVYVMTSGEVDLKAAKHLSFENIDSSDTAALHREGNRLKALEVEKLRAAALAKDQGEQIVHSLRRAWGLIGAVSFWNDTSINPVPFPSHKSILCCNESCAMLVDRSGVPTCFIFS